MKFAKTLIAAAGLAVAGFAAQASTVLNVGSLPSNIEVTFTGNVSTPSDSSCSNSPAPEPTCFKLNIGGGPSSTGATVTITATSGTFDLYPFWAGYNGQPAELYFAAFAGATLVFDDTYTAGNAVVEFDDAGTILPKLTGLTSIYFDNLGAGTVEISAIIFDNAPAVRRARRDCRPAPPQVTILIRPMHLRYEEGAG